MQESNANIAAPRIHSSFHVLQFQPSIRRHESMGVLRTCNSFWQIRRICRETLTRVPVAEVLKLESFSLRLEIELKQTADTLTGASENEHAAF